MNFKICSLKKQTQSVVFNGNLERDRPSTQSREPVFDLLARILAPIDLLQSVSDRHSWSQLILCPHNEFLPFQPLHLSQTRELSKDTMERIVNVHNAPLVFGSLSKWFRGGLVESATVRWNQNQALCHRLKRIRLEDRKCQVWPKEHNPHSQAQGWKYALDLLFYRTTWPHRGASGRGHAL